MTDWKVAFGTYIVEDDELFATTFTEEKAKQIVHEHNAYEGLVEALAMKLYRKFAGIHGTWESTNEEYRKEYRAIAIGIAGETEKVE